MTGIDHSRRATELETARRKRRPIAPLTDADPQLTIRDAYRIAQVGIRSRIERGAKLVGHKIGLTSRTVQRQLGVGEPDYGALLDEMEFAAGSIVPAGLLIAPRVELEFAFHLGTDLKGPGVTAADVAAATESVQPAVEIVDSRIADWRITLPDTIADNASSGGFVLGGKRTPLRDLDPAASVKLAANGKVEEEGRVDAVLGNPVHAVVWLANALAEQGESLAAGQVVLSGACTPMVPARPGVRYAGDFGRFGVVDVAFEGLAW
jgi:2-keto-4-pentenoate hydratase